MTPLFERLKKTARENGVEWGGRESFLVALICAEAALPVWELAHPEDKRPQLATEAARAWLQDPTDATSRGAFVASVAAGEAADETDDAAVCAAACAASWAARAATWPAVIAADAVEETPHSFDWTPHFAAWAGVNEPVMLRAFAHEVAGTPLEPLITAELL